PRALWLGAGQLAVTGYDGSAKGQHMEAPSGLQLIDTTTWTVRQVDRHASSAVLAAGRLLAFGTAFGTGPGRCQSGLRAAPVRAGRPPAGASVRAKQVGWIQANDEFAYVQLLD